MPEMSSSSSSSTGRSTASAASVLSGKMRNAGIPRFFASLSRQSRSALASDSSISGSGLLARAVAARLPAAARDPSRGSPDRDRLPPRVGLGSERTPPPCAGPTGAPRPLNRPRVAPPGCRCSPVAPLVRQRHALEGDARPSFSKLSRLTRTSPARARPPSSRSKSRRSMPPAALAVQLARRSARRARRSASSTPRSDRRLSRARARARSGRRWPPGAQHVAEAARPRRSSSSPKWRTSAHHAAAAGPRRSGASRRAGPACGARWPRSGGCQPSGRGRTSVRRRRSRRRGSRACSRAGSSISGVRRARLRGRLGAATGSRGERPEQPSRGPRPSG